MQEIKKTNGNGTFWKEMGKNAASSAIGGVVLALVSKGIEMLFPKAR